ncbi:MAG: histidine phosphatase family protein [Enhydrobacter sp.]|nr:MAG: histidine phosphatase family protein [Enhydrobacter sp.]
MNPGPGRRTSMLGLVLAALPAGAPARTADEAVRRAISDLRQGGFVIYIRHGETGGIGADRAPVMGDCSTQRNLDATGRAQVRRMGEDFRALGLPVGKVLSSEYCRCWQHAEAMFGKDGYRIVEALSLPRSYPAVTADDRRLKTDALRALLAEPPAPGTNTVLVSHGNNMLMLTGYHPGTQGEAVIFRPDGKGGYARIASVLPPDWTAARR